MNMKMKKGRKMNNINECPVCSSQKTLHISSVNSDIIHSIPLERDALGNILSKLEFVACAECNNSYVRVIREES